MDIPFLPRSEGDIPFYLGDTWIRIFFYLGGGLCIFLPGGGYSFFTLERGG